VIFETHSAPGHNRRHGGLDRTNRASQIGYFQAGAHIAWARRRKLDLAELADASWILAPPQTWNYEWVAQAFAARGLGAPKVSLVTFNVHLTAHFLRKGLSLTAYPRSWARLNDFKVLPVSLPLRSWPLSIVTVKDRTQSPAVERFMDCAREAGKWIADLDLRTT